MRLINTDTLALEEFINARDCPKYAILSHRWLRQELTYQEYQDEAKKQRKPESLGKVRKACDLARGRNHAYIWIDTCCIDKSSSAEISEAVNCMFAWYRGAEVCYAYMSDVQPGYNVSEMLEMARMGDLDQSPEPTPLLHVPFHKSEWFTRGWTLQELIVPPEVEFFAHDWSRLGTRSEMAPIITKACGVDAYALTPGVDLNWVSVARKMYWASSRTTSRDEDLAYCLLGIFDVNMPLLYGEGGARAFLRLQEEIVRRSNDQSIFAWDHLSQHPASRGPFAASPRAFRTTGKHISLPRKSRRHDETIEVVNIGTTLILALKEDPFLQASTFTESEIGHISRSTRMSSVRAALDCQFGSKPGSRFIVDVSIEKDIGGLGCVILRALSLSESERIDTTRWIPTEVSLRSFAAPSGLSLEETFLRPYHISIQLENDLTILDAFPRPTWDKHTSSLFVTGRYPTRYQNPDDDSAYSLGGLILIRPKSVAAEFGCLCLSFWDPWEPNLDQSLLPWLAGIPEGSTFSTAHFVPRRAESHWQGSKTMVGLFQCPLPKPEALPNEILMMTLENPRPEPGAFQTGPPAFEAIMKEDDMFTGIHYQCSVRRCVPRAAALLSNRREDGASSASTRKAPGSSPKKRFFQAFIH